MDSPQVVRVDGHTSYPVVVHIGTSQSCVLSPPLYSHLTHNCGSKHASNSIRKFARDSSRGVNFPCQQNSIQERDCCPGKVEQGKWPFPKRLHHQEIIENYRKRGGIHSSATNKSKLMERVDTFKYRGVNIHEVLTWTCHTTALITTANQHLYGP